MLGLGGKGSTECAYFASFFPPVIDNGIKCMPLIGGSLFLMALANVMCLLHVRRFCRAKTSTCLPCKTHAWCPKSWTLDSGCICNVAHKALELGSQKLGHPAKFAAA
eukprot:1158885-Pelagomonas_calceolata.AAC.7